MKNKLLGKLPRRTAFQALSTVKYRFLFVLVALATVPGCQLIEDFFDDHDDIISKPGLELVVEGLSQPIAMVESPDSSGRLFVVDQTGLIRIVDADGNLVEEPFLDVRDKIVTLNARYDERGLLGLAFHPDYASNGRFFVNYSAPLRTGAPAGWNHTSIVAEYMVSAASPLVADKSSEKIILAIDKPQSNHNGGTLAFGPADHYLYFSIGDGGGGDDVGEGHVQDWYEKNAGGNGQDITQNLLGSILRIDVNGGAPYSIPAFNPFVGKEGLDEIYAYGFRNPYRFSFDMGGEHRLFVGDAGQELWEEVSIVTRGGNYGWNVKEGTHCFDAANPEVSAQDCPSTDPAGNPLIDPVIELKNSKQSGGYGLVIVGGNVYRGNALPQYEGKYIFGMWSLSFGAPDGSVFVATPQASGLWNFKEIEFANTPTGKLKHYVLGFGQDLKGEVYVLTSDASGPTGNSGKLYKIINHTKK